MELSDAEREEIMKFQQIQQQTQVLLMQKQNVQMQTAEIENALKEIEKTKDKEVFEVVGNVMIKKDKKMLQDSLKEKKDILELRISALDKQTNKLAEQATALQKKLANLFKEKKK